MDIFHIQSYYLSQPRAEREHRTKSGHSFGRRDWGPFIASVGRVFSFYMVGGVFRLIPVTIAAMLTAWRLDCNEANVE